MTRNDPDARRSEGRMTWEQALAGPLSGMECLWQDLDGVHRAPPPARAPCTSILWAWSADGRALRRARLDGGTVFLAGRTVGPDGEDPVVARPWDPQDGRVSAHRTAAGSGPVLEQRWEQIVDHGLEGGTGPVTFLRPAGSTRRGCGDGSPVAGADRYLGHG